MAPAQIDTLCPETVMVPVASVGQVPLTAGIFGPAPLVVTEPLLLPDTDPPSCLVPPELPPTFPELELVLLPKEPLLLVSVPLDPFAFVPLVLPGLPLEEPLSLELDELPLPLPLPLPLDDEPPRGPWPNVVCVFEPQLAATPAAQKMERIGADVRKRWRTRTSLAAHSVRARSMCHCSLRVALDTLIDLSNSPDDTAILR